MGHPGFIGERPVATPERADKLIDQFYTKLTGHSFKEEENIHVQKVFFKQAKTMCVIAMNKQIKVIDFFLKNDMLKHPSMAEEIKKVFEESRDFIKDYEAK